MPAGAASRASARPGPGAGGRRGRRSAAAAPGGAPDGEGHQPEKGLLAGGRLYQGRPRRLLRDGGAVSPALPPRPPPGPHALPRRDHGEVLLPEGRPRVRPRVDPHRAHLLARHGAGHPLLRRGRRRVAPLRGKPRHDPAAFLGGASPAPGPAGLARPPPRPEGRPPHRRGGGRPHPPAPFGAPPAPPPPHAPWGPPPPHRRAPL